MKLDRNRYSQNQKIDRQKSNRPVRVSRLSDSAEEGDVEIVGDDVYLREGGKWLDLSKNTKALIAALAKRVEALEE